MLPQTKPYRKITVIINLLFKSFYTAGFSNIQKPKHDNWRLYKQCTMANAAGHIKLPGKHAFLENYSFFG